MKDKVIMNSKEMFLEKKYFIDLKWIYRLQGEQYQCISTCRFCSVSVLLALYVAVFVHFKGLIESTEV